jgi:hypothetical protein
MAGKYGNPQYKGKEEKRETKNESRSIGRQDGIQLKRTFSGNQVPLFGV